MWRLAFFSRLEERKGIKLFVDAVGSLNVTNDKFEVPLISYQLNASSSVQAGAEQSVALIAGMQRMPALTTCVP